MTNKTKISVIVVSAVVGAFLIFGGGWYASKNYYQGKKPIVTVKPNGPGTTTVVTIPTTPDEWLKWKNAKLKINGKMVSKDIFLVDVTDGFKAGQQEFKIAVTCPEEGKNVLIFNYVGLWGFGHDDMSFSHGAQIQYTRMLIPMFGISVGVLATQRDLGVTGGFTVKF